ncbi:hypothetical protein COV20_05470 [Candidatus Woesearchaeota archaeon CG10_big_fil_rev_8_21_14_0_10_45_16]|nr:MAG: hypothetical protein COV20_05470 [Candidatus Woesearchaeota archaeon CG10_big_fil_rev_8_21_14_0_10_45_16]
MSEKRGLATALATTTLIGTIIGAGILGIPYTLAKAGVFYGFLILLGIGLVYLLINLFTGEFVLRTKEQHQLPGYTEKYLGKEAKAVMFFAMIFSLYGALIAYLIGEGATLYSLFGVGSPLLFTVLFFLVASFIVWRGVKTAGKAELLLILFLVLVVCIIGIFSYDRIHVINFMKFNPAYLFLPYGVAIFAYFGMMAIPEMQEILHKKKKQMKRAIILGSLVPIVIYILFAFIVVGVVGVDNFNLLSANERIATIALGLYAHPVLGVLANILAFLSMSTSFLTISLALVGMYHYDYGLSRRVSLFLTLSIPLVIAVLNLATFIEILGITGAVAGGIETILIIFIYWRAKKLGDRKPEYSLGNHYLLGALFILMFIIGVIGELWQTLF